MDDTHYVRASVYLDDYEAIESVYALTSVGYDVRLKTEKYEPWGGGEFPMVYVHSTQLAGIEMQFSS